MLNLRINKAGSTRNDNKLAIKIMHLLKMIRIEYLSNTTWHVVVAN